MSIFNERTKNMLNKLDISKGIKNIKNITEIYTELINRNIDSLNNFELWIKDTDDIGSSISEEFGWRYINMTRFTNNKEYQKQYQEYVMNIMPKVSLYINKIQKKLIDSPFLKNIEDKEGYKIWIQQTLNELQLYKESNIKIFSELDLDSQEYSSIVGKMTIKYNNEELTLQQAATKLESTDRIIRQDIYEKIFKRRFEDKDILDNLFSKMVKKRHQIALNAGFENFTDYMFLKLSRFDYTKDDCIEFHNSVKQEIVPIHNLMIEIRKEKLNLPILKPWDLAVDIFNDPPLKPFKNIDDLLKKTINVFNILDPFFGDCIKIMQDINHLDLESRMSKAPGGYNYPLYRTGVPFIFMNATHTFDDMITMLHEGGHAVHSFLTKNLPLTYFKNTPMEIAEVASMSMELLSMGFWDEFFDNYKNLLRAKYLQLNRVISVLPWVATIDKFQHWIYENYNHTTEERKTMWNSIFNEFASNIIDWDGQEESKDYAWQKQLHLYEVPFYYIEYAISQLAAIAIWKNFKEDPKNALLQYKEALELGGTKSIPETYETAGIKFSFKKDYIKEVMAFIKKEILELKDQIEKY